MLQVVDVESLKLVHTFTPFRKEPDSKFSPGEPPITRMFTSSDGRWLAAVNCFGDVYVFSLKIQRYGQLVPGYAITPYFYLTERRLK